MSPAPNTAFCRPIVYGTRGDDVLAHKIAMSRGYPKVYPPPEDGTHTLLAGEFFVTAVKKIQVIEGIKPVTGKLGVATHEAMERQGWAGHPGEFAFNARAIKLLADFCKEHELSDDDKARRDIVDYAMLCHARRHLIGYSQRRPFTTMSDLTDADYSVIDCSGFVTRCCEAGGVPNPNYGQTYSSGQGYTGTLLAGTSPTTREALKKGDLVFYGFTTSSRPGFPYGSPTHVAIYVGGGMVVSMGSDPGPSYLPLTYRTTNAHTPFRKIRTQ